jgi:hypothetical protein
VERNLEAKMDKELKSKYKKDFATLTRLINDFDPCELIKGGAPLDEYDCLTQQLLSYIYNNRTRQEIKDMIIREVDEHFGMPVENDYEIQYHNQINKFIDTIEQTFVQTAN